MMEGMLDRYFRGKAMWTSHRNVASRSTSLVFSCTRNTPVISFTDAVLEDAEHAEKFVLTTAMRTFDRHHRLHAIRDDDLDPIETCSNCLNYVTIPNEKKMERAELFEYSERQAILWMQRANGLRG